MGTSLLCFCLPTRPSAAHLPLSWFQLLYKVEAKPSLPAPPQQLPRHMWLRAHEHTHAGAAATRAGRLASCAVTKGHSGWVVARLWEASPSHW